MKTIKFPNFIFGLFRAVILIGIGFLIIYPLIIKFSSSIKSFQDLSDSTVVYIPRNISFLTYQSVLDGLKNGFFRTLLYTIVFCALMALLQTISCTLTAYGVGRFDFFGRNIVFGLVLLTLIIPPQAILFPLYLKFKYFNIFSLFSFSGKFSGTSVIDSVLPFSLLSCGAVAAKNGLFIYLLKQFYTNMPLELEEAAYVDGCGDFKTFLKIMIPSSATMLVTIFLFAFVWQWTDYFTTITLAPNLPTLGMQFFSFTARITEDHSSLVSAVYQSPQYILLIVPLLILYVFTQRFFVESVARSGIVG